MEVNNNGVWKPSKPFVKTGGDWRECNEGFVKVDGEWRRFLSPTETGVEEFIVTLGTERFNTVTAIGYSSWIYQNNHGDITPRTLNGVEVITLRAVPDSGNGPVRFEIWLNDDLPPDFFSKVSVEGLGEFYSVDAISGFVAYFTAWQWNAPHNWSGNVGDKRKVVFYR